MMTHKTGCRWAAATICPAPLLPRGRRSAEITISSYLFARWHLFRHVGYFRHQQQVDLLILKVVTESRVTWATSAPILLFLSFSGQRDGHLSFVTTCHSVRCWMFSLVILWCGLIVFFFLKQYSKIQIRYYLVSLRWRYYRDYPVDTTNNTYSRLTDSYLRLQWTSFVNIELSKAYYSNQRLCNQSLSSSSSRHL